jgi:hypothetical protein
MNETREATADQIRRQAAHDVYQRMAFYSFAVWTLGTLILFIIFASGNPRPIPSAAMSMLVPLIPAVLPWLLYRPIVRLVAHRRARATS